MLFYCYLFYYNVNDNIINVMHVKFKDGCPLPTVDILWSTYAYPVARLWSQFYLSKMQNFSILTSQDPTYVYLRED